MDIRIKVIRDDNIDAFGAYCYNPQDEEKKILLNIYAITTDGIMNSDSTKEWKETMIQVLMHEFGHALEEYFDKEFDDKFIYKIINSYYTNKE